MILIHIEYLLPVLSTVTRNEIDGAKRMTFYAYYSEVVETCVTGLAGRKEVHQRVPFVSKISAH